MPTAEKSKRIRKSAIIKGVILGVIFLSLNIFSYYFITGITKTTWLIVAGSFFFSIIIPVIVVIFLCINMRKKVGGYWDFKQATTGIFTMFLISYVILYIGRDMVFAKFIEPNMVKKTELVMLDVKARSLAMQGRTQSQINAQVDDMRKGFDSQGSPGIGTILQGFIINIIFLFVIALVFGSIFKKDLQPVPSTAV